MEKRRNLLRTILIGTVSVMAMARSVSAQATGDNTVPETVTVTGSRLSANGFQAPTPVTVSAADVLQNAAPANIADALNQLPQFNGSITSTNGGSSAAANQAVGQNLLSLRGLGSNRTLVLLDGHRLPGTNQMGSADIDMTPQNLVSHVDVVTGGASAAYGSDAVAGVVNFALDTKFTGFKGDIHTGESTYSDSEQFHIDGAYGSSLFAGRGRILLSGDYFLEDGIGINDLLGKDNGRQWWNYNAGLMPNPVAGATPGILLVPHLGSSVGTAGGLITSSALKGTQFLAGGQTSTFNCGNPCGSLTASNGDGYESRAGLTPDQRRGTGFAHFEYDVNDWMTVYAEGFYGKERTRAVGANYPGVGANAQMTIFSGNPYLPASIQAAMTTGAIASFTFGKYFTDLPPETIDSHVESKRLLIGAKGDFGMIGGKWHYDSYYQNGGSDQWLAQQNLPNQQKFFAAVDAVRNSAGQIVCNASQTGTAYSDCVPVNVFGPSSVTPQAAAYFEGAPTKDLHLQQQVASINLNGDLGNLNFGAGPINVATGFEYRREAGTQTSDLASQTTVSNAGLRGVSNAIVGRVGLYLFNDQLPFRGAYDVKEGYGEVGIPLLHDLPFAEILDINGAARYADYSQSGGITTWKYGVNWLLVDDLRLRGTISQDVRAPSLLELFNPQTLTSFNFFYPASTSPTRSINSTVIVSGNPNLKPERALTHTYGVVLQPRWIPNFTASVDYFNINISNAIGTPSPQVGVVDQCFLGNQQACALFVTQPAGATGAAVTSLVVRTPQENLNRQVEVGYDLEGDYSTQIFDGGLQLRALATHLMDQYTLTPGALSRTSVLSTPATTTTSASPVWRGTMSATWTNDDWTFFAQERWISAGKVNPTYIPGVSISQDGSIPAIFYTDFTVKYRTPIAWLGANPQEFYFTVNNFWNQAPPAASGGIPTNYILPFGVNYDIIGRYFTLGLRIQTN